MKKIIRKPKDQSRVIAPLDYNPHLAKASQVFLNHRKTMLISAPHLKEVFLSPPMPAYRQPDNIRKILCKSTLYPVTRANRLQRGAHIDAPGWKPCGKPCKICSYTMEKTSTVAGSASGYLHKIQQPVSCDTTNCIYYWTCTKPNCSDFPNKIDSQNTGLPKM